MDGSDPLLNYQRALQSVAFFAFKQGTRRSSRRFSCLRTRGNLFPIRLSLGVTTSCATMVSDKKEDNNDIRWLWCCCNTESERRFVSRSTGEDQGHCVVIQQV